MFRSLRRPLARLGRWPRLGAVALCLLLALDSAVGTSHARSVGSRTVAVVVAARSVPAGHVLTAADLVVTRWPAALRPGDTHDTVRPLLGDRTAGPLEARQAVTSSQLVGADLAAGLPTGETAVTVGLDDPRAGELVHRGDRIDLLATPLPSDLGGPSGRVHEPVDTVAAGVLVLDVLPSRTDIDTDTETGAHTEMIIAADQATMLDIIGRQSTEAFTAALISP